MCGIAGIWHLNNSKLDEQKLRLFTDSMYHRGPDGAGYYVDASANLGLGHRRLSILDLSEAGKQPMSFADERYWITYNGEIYNFIELRSELSTKGYTFRTDSDTEVLLSAYHCWGKDCLYKFNGMWAFAIWDKQEQSLFMARDRFGVKPLYYFHNPGSLFAFASETFAFKHLKDFKRTINPSLLQRNILDYRHMETAGYTMFNGILQLSAGCYMQFKKSDVPSQKRWWNTLEHSTVQTRTFDEQVSHFKELFEDACKIRLRSDVPLASALSGGVDSSAVYCMIKHLMQKNQQTLRMPANWQKAFVATFPGTPQDEKRFAEEVINYTKGEVKYIVPDYQNLADDIIASTIKFDGITGTPIIAVSDVYKAMRENGIIVSMDGHGADETMFGYRASVAEVYFDYFLRGDTRNEKDLLETFVNMFDESEQARAGERLKERAQNVKSFESSTSQRNKLIKATRNFVKSLVAKNNVSYMHPLNTNAWFNHVKLSVPLSVNGHYPSLQNLSRSEKHLLSDFHIEHIPYNLRDFDRASMQHGIEIRMPFMDYRLVTFLFSLKPEYKVGHGFTKRILRESMKGLMPESIRTRKLKIGLSAPITSWFNNQLGEFITDQANSSAFLNSPYWNGKVISEFVNENTKARTWNDDTAQKFWNVLNAHIIITHDN